MMAVPSVPKAGHGLALALRHAIQIAEPFEMLGAGVGDQTDGGPRDAHERGNVADRIRTHLDHGAAM